MCWVIYKLVLTKFPLKLFKFLMKLFLGISNQVSIMASKVSIEKYNDVDLLIDISNDIYRLKTGAIKENYYLIILKDCYLYVQICANVRISFKTERKSNEHSYEDQYI